MLIFQHTFFLVFISFLVNHIRTSEVIPNHHRSSIVQEGVQIVNEIEPHEIYIHQFESSIAKSYFFFHAIEKNTLIYHYYTENVKEINIKEQDIILNSYSGLFAKPTNIKSYSNFELQANNNLTYKDQNILIVYCPISINCTYSLLYLQNQDEYQEYKMHFNLLPIDKESIFFQLSPNSIYPIKMNISNDNFYNEKCTVYIKSTVFSGMIEKEEYKLDLTNTIDNKTINLGNNDIVVYNVDSTSSISFQINPMETSIVLLSVYFNEIKDSDIEIGLSEIHFITLPDKKTFTINKNNFYNDIPLVLNFKADNCNLNITETSKRALIFSDKPNFYQVHLTETDNYSIEVSMTSFEDEENKNNEDICIFYTYGTYQRNIDSIAIMEGITYRTRLSVNDYKSINYEFPYFYDEKQSNDMFMITFEPMNSNKVDITIMIGTYLYKTYILFENSFIIVENKSLSMYCIKLSLCMINIKLSIKTEENFVNLRINAKSSTIQYIEKNKMILEQLTTKNKKQYFTSVKQNDNINIKLINENEHFCKYVVNERKKDKKTEKEYLNCTEVYTVKEECVFGCYLYIYLIPSYEDDSDNKMNMFGIFIQTNYHSIQGLPNEKIKGNFDDLIKNYTFKFSLKNIKKFQIVLGGSSVKYQLVNVDPSVLCCDTFNETYYSEEGSTFIDNVIGDGTVNYNITIKITATSTISESFLSLFEITVVPFDVEEFPIYYIKDGETIDCYTGKNNDIVHLIFESDNSGNEEGFFAYYASFYGKKPEKFNFNIINIDRKDYQEMNTTEMKNIFNDDSFFYEGYFKLVKSFYDVFFLSIKTEFDQKFTFKAAQQAKNSDTFLSLQISNYQYEHIFKIKDYTSITIMINEQCYQKDLVYQLEIQKIYGTTYLINPELEENNSIKKLTGTRIINFNKKIETINLEYTFDFIMYIQFNVFLKNQKRIQLINPLTINNYVYMYNPFPIRYGLKMQTQIDKLNLSIKLKYNMNNSIIYDINNLTSSCYYIDSNSLDNELLSKKEIKGNIIKTMPILIIEDNDTNNFNKYTYLIIELEEKNATLNWTDSKIEIEIQPLISYTNNQTILLDENSYYYSKLNNSYQLFEIALPPSFFAIEFEYSSCDNSNDIFSIEISANEEEIFPSEMINNISKYGKEIRWSFYSDWEDNIFFPSDTILLNFSLNQTESTNEENDHYYMIKYKRYVIEKSQLQLINNLLNFDDLTSSYDPINQIINSKWGAIKKQYSKNETYRSVYNYYLYEYNEDNPQKQSICPSKLFSYSNSTYNTYLNVSSVELKEKEYEVAVIANIYVDGEEYLFAFKPDKVKIIPNRNTIIWYFVLFGIIILMIIFGTFRLYNEIQKKEKEINEKIYQRKKVEII